MVDHLAEAGREGLRTMSLVPWTLVPLGLAGGFVPSPSAIVVLLGAIALGRAWFGVGLVVAYGADMAATLTGVGMLLVGARGAIERRVGGSRGGGLASHRCSPRPTAAAIVCGGLYPAVRGALRL